MADHPESPSDGLPLIRPFLNRAAPKTTGDSSIGAEPVRAYVMTGGRTKSSITLDFHTMLSIVPGAHGEGSRLTFERAKVFEACKGDPLSVAEVAVRVGVAIGVIQILAADLIEEKLLRPHIADRKLHSDIAFLERLSHGIRAL